MARYSVYVRTREGLNTIPFEKNGKLEDKSDLELFDIYFNAKVKSIDEFLNNRIKEGKIKGNPLECFIGYKVNGEIKKKPIITNNLFIYNAAMNYAIKARKTKNRKDLYIDEYPQIKDFVDEIINLAVNDNLAFKSMFKSNGFPQHVYDLLNELRKLYKKEDYSSKNDDINQLKNQISYNIRKYNYLRSIYLWKDNYLKKEIKNNNQQNNDFEYDMNIFEWAETNIKNKTDIDIEEELSDEELNEINQFNHDYKNRYKIEITNPNIDFYFKQGGLEAVLSNCSLDEIESLSDDEKNYIGYDNKSKRR